MKAATPSKTFWENFMMVLNLSATSPAIVPDATTAPVVSIEPPNHAPVVSAVRFIHLARSGMKIIIGIATISTREIR